LTNTEETPSGLQEKFADEKTNTVRDVFSEFHAKQKYLAFSVMCFKHLTAVEELLKLYVNVTWKF
jgi:hypothetical protein